MSKQIQAKSRPEVAELERLLGDAAKASPELWATIRQSVDIADFVPNFIQAEAGQRIEITSGTETTSFYQAKES